MNSAKRELRRGKSDRVASAAFTVRILLAPIVFFFFSSIRRWYLHSLV
jgi:hypothetical protein